MSPGNRLGNRFGSRSPSPSKKSVQSSRHVMLTLAKFDSVSNLKYIPWGISGHRALPTRGYIVTYGRPSAAYHVLYAESMQYCVSLLKPCWNLLSDQSPTVFLANRKHIRNTLAIRDASTASKWYPCILNATFYNTTFACNSTKMHTCRSFAFLRKTTLSSARQKRVLPDTL